MNTNKPLHCRYVGKVQVFDADGNYLRGWRTPEIEHGKPVGLGMATMVR